MATINTFPFEGVYYGSALIRKVLDSFTATG